MKNQYPASRFIVTILVLAFLFSLAGCFAAPQTTAASSNSTSENGQTQALESESTAKIPLRLGYPTAGVDFIGGVAGIAQEQGFLDEELGQAGYAIDYEGFTGAGPAVNEALASDKIDFALYADFPGLVIQSKGIELELVSIVSLSAHAGVIVAKDSPYQSLADLKGKKIAFPKGTFVQKYLLQALASAGLQESDVELINMTTDAESALLSGSVDAVAHVESFLTRLSYGEAQSRIISSSRENPEWTGAMILVARKEYLAKQDAAGAAFLRALLRAKQFAAKNPDQVYQLFAEKNQTSLEEASYLNQLDENRFDYYTLEVNSQGLDKLAQDKQFLLENGLIQNDFDLAAWGNNRYYEEAASDINP